MKKMKPRINALIVLAMAFSTKANAITGVEFSRLPYSERGTYVIGLDDGMAFMGASCANNGQKTYEQTLNAVNDFMKAHPDRLKKPMADIYAEAIINAFDCGTAGKEL
jgi:hypothetical protein